MDGERISRSVIGVGVVACIVLFAVGFAAPVLPPEFASFLFRGAGVSSSAGTATPAASPAGGSFTADGAGATAGSPGGADPATTLTLEPTVVTTGTTAKPSASPNPAPPPYVASVEVTAVTTWTTVASTAAPAVYVTIPMTTTTRAATTNATAAPSLKLPGPTSPNATSETPGTVATLASRLTQDTTATAHRTTAQTPTLNSTSTTPASHTTASLDHRADNGEYHHRDGFDHAHDRARPPYDHGGPNHGDHHNHVRNANPGANHPDDGADRPSDEGDHRGDPVTVTRGDGRRGRQGRSSRRSERGRLTSSISAGQRPAPLREVDRDHRFEHVPFREDERRVEGLDQVRKPRPAWSRPGAHRPPPGTVRRQGRRNRAHTRRGASTDRKGRGAG